MEEVNAADYTVLSTTIIIGLALGIFGGLLLVFIFFIILLVISLVWFTKKVNKKKKKQAYQTQKPRGEEQTYALNIKDRGASGQRAASNTDTAVAMRTNASYIPTVRHISTKGYKTPCTHVIDQSAPSSNDYDNDPKDHYDYVIVI